MKNRNRLINSSESTAILMKQHKLLREAGCKCDPPAIGGKAPDILMCKQCRTEIHTRRVYGQ